MKHRRKSDNCSENFAAIDVSAAQLEVLALLRGRRVRAEVENTPAGHQRLLKLLPPGTRVCLEATGLYHLEVALTLVAARRPVMVLNPRVARDYQRARLVRAKTDRVDVAGLLEYVQRQPFQPWSPPPARFLVLRQLGRRLRQLAEQLTAERNRLAAQRHLGTEADVLLADVRAGIAQLRARQQRLEREAEKLARADAQAAERLQWLRSLKGIGQRSALLLLGELLVLPAHMGPREWVAHCGLDPAPFESGSSVRAPRRISKQGNSHIRGALYMPALVAVRWNPCVRAHYQHLLARGKKKLVALVAIMRKLLHAIWGMFHHQQPFDPSRFSQAAVPLPTA